MSNDVTRLSKSHSKFQALIKLAAGGGTPGLTGDCQLPAVIIRAQWTTLMQACQFIITASTVRDSFKLELQLENLSQVQTQASVLFALI